MSQGAMARQERTHRGGRGERGGPLGRAFHLQPRRALRNQASPDSFGIGRSACAMSGVLLPLPTPRDLGRMNGALDTFALRSAVAGGDDARDGYTTRQVGKVDLPIPNEWGAAPFVRVRRGGSRPWRPGASAYSAPPR